MYGSSDVFSQALPHCNQSPIDRKFSVPKKRETVRPTIFLPGQIERITASTRESTKESEIAVATSTTATHAPTIAYHIKDAILMDGSIYVGSYKQFVADKSLFVAGAREPSRLNSSALASSYVGIKYFGHWLTDDCLTYLLAEKFSIPLCLRMSNRSWHQKQYEGFFGQDWTPTDRALIDHLVVFQDFAQNSLKRKRYRVLRDRLKKLVPNRSSGNARLFETRTKWRTTRYTK